MLRLRRRGTVNGGSTGRRGVIKDFASSACAALAVSYERHCTAATSIALAILAIVVLFRRGRFIMNSMEGSQTIPTYVRK